MFDRAAEEQAPSIFVHMHAFITGYQSHYHSEPHPYRTVTCTVRRTLSIIVWPWESEKGANLVPVKMMKRFPLLIKPVRDKRINA